MSNMQNFVKKRDGEDGPQQAQQPNPNRLAIGAKAKMPTKGNRQPHSIKNLPARGGLGNAQNISATIQHGPGRRPSGSKQKYDTYDTDAESLDTTVNQFVAHNEDSHHGHQNHYVQHGPVTDLAGGESEGDEDRSTDREDEEEEAEDRGVHADYELTPSEVNYLEREGKARLCRDEAVEFLLLTRPRGLPDVDGDSYPTTTDGDPIEWHGKQEPTSGAFAHGVPVTPPPKGRKPNGHAPAPVPSQRGPIDTGMGQPVDRTHAMFHQGAALRGQQHRTNNNNPNLQNGHSQKNTTALFPSSQPPTYTQVAREEEPLQPMNPQSRPIQQPLFQQSHQPQQNTSRQVPGLLQVTVQPPAVPDVRLPAKRSLEARTKAVPVIQQPPQQQVPVEHEQVLTDYDADKLFEMNYAQLKNESFDTDPRAPDQPLGENMREKPLNDRLEHVQKNFDAQKQSEFFRSLPTTEWEDAGDWFLQQFSSVITRTKEARQRKRKLAEGFEDEIEKRQKHVSKKQRQVEEAMDKMKAQGEGLVRSPRPSKSPRPKKG